MKKLIKFSISSIVFLCFLVLNNTSFCQGNSTVQQNTHKKDNSLSSAIDDPKTGRVEEYYTAFWYARCNGELVEIAKGKLKKSAISMTVQKVIKKVDLNAFNNAIHYKAQACGKLAKPAEEYFFVQLSSDGKIEKDKNHGDANNSMVPTCWNVRNLNDYISSCGNSGTMGSSIPGSCKSINLCYCETLKKTYSCQPNACPSMYVVCH